MSNEAVCRTAPATPGLLIIVEALVLFGFQVENIGMPVNKIGGKLLNSNKS